MEELLWPIVMLLAAALLIYLGIRSRKKAYANYQDNLRLYTATTTMTVASVEKQMRESWIDRDDGTRETVYETIYLPTYEYTVDGKAYQYSSLQSIYDPKAVGKQVVGYYNPQDPGMITENKPRNPIFGGFLFFFWAAILVAMGLSLLWSYVSLYL